MLRLRLHYAKTQALRYTSNLDMHKIWERTLRRARLPLAYSQGFHPQPRLNQACPLPLGLLSRAELIDIWLEQEIPLKTILEMLTPALPPGLDILSIQEVDLKEPAIPTQVTASEYHAIPFEIVPAVELEVRIEKLLAENSLPRQWRQKPYDLRPLIHVLCLLPASQFPIPTLFMNLSAREGATGRSDAVLAALGLDPFTARVERIRLVLANKGYSTFLEGDKSTSSNDQVIQNIYI
jgi:radical SAM-linked protein